MTKHYAALFLIFLTNPLWSQTQGCVSDIAIAKYGTITLFMNNGKTYSWGKNDKGQTGNGNTQNQNTPVLHPTNPYKEIAHAQQFTLALTKDHKIYSWGANTLGYLGNGNILDQTTPTQMGTDSDWSQIDVGRLHAVALKKNGTIWGWGNNAAYELTSQDLPIYQNNYYTTPTQLDVNTDWKAIYAGSNRTFAIKNNGTLWARGRDHNGSLGTGYTWFVLNFTQIGNHSDWKYISSSIDENFTLGLKTNNTLWGFGENTNGALGSGSNMTLLTPTQIGTDTWKDIASGSFHSVGIKSDGTLWHWGTYGWINNVILIPQMYVPTQIGTENNWEKVMAGYAISYALRADQSVWAWGYNSEGWYGTGTTTSSATPVLVFQCQTSSVQEFDPSSLIIYPNPITDWLQWAQNIAIEQVEAYNVNGKRVLSQHPNNPRVDVSHLAQGMYFMFLKRTDGLTYKTKFVKK